MALVEIAADTELWTSEKVKEAYAEALVTIERTVPRQGPRAASGGLRYVHTTEDIEAQHDRFGIDSRIIEKGKRTPAQILMPKPDTRVRVRYSAEQIEWATFVICGGSFHGSDKLGPWTAGIIAKSVTRESFEAWGRQVALRRLGGHKRALSEIAAEVGLPLRTFHRYVTGAAEQIAKALNGARVEVR
jgi:hypothetical protein